MVKISRNKETGKSKNKKQKAESGKQKARKDSRAV